jgi:hypothetical protein
LIGYVVRPGAYRRANVIAPEGDTLRFSVADLGSSLFFAVAQASGEVIASGEATIVADGARVRVPPSTSEVAVFLVPEKIFLGTRRGVGLPNLWDGFDVYRDKLLVHLSQIKFGPGFRFFIDALGPDLWPRGEAERLLPTSAAFRAEWSAWLKRRYRSMEICVAPGVWMGPRSQPWTRPPRSCPLWSGGKGLPAYHNRGTQQRVPAEAARSAFWTDLNAFKAESVQGYMNSIADVLKREIADVPVVFRASGDSPLFANLPPGAASTASGLTPTAGAVIWSRTPGVTCTPRPKAPPKPSGCP